MEHPPAFAKIAHAIGWLHAHRDEQPSLAGLAQELQLSEGHVQRLFTAWVGISPKQFLKFLSKERALECLRRGETVLDSTYDTGLSSPGRLHDLLVTTHAVTPGEARRQGEDVAFAYGRGPTPFGEAVIAWNERGISFLGFCNPKEPARVVDEMRSTWPRAMWRETGDADRQLASVFDRDRDRPLRLWLRGSPFQLKVWEALLRVPPGAGVTYGQVALRLGREGAARAVGGAVGANPVAWLIPCHRVITQTTGIGGYRWGPERKLLMLAVEAAHSRAESAWSRR